MLFRSKVQRPMSKVKYFSRDPDVGLWTLDFGLLLLTTFYELLRLIEPTLIGVILVSRRRFDSLDAGLH